MGTKYYFSVDSCTVAQFINEERDKAAVTWAESAITPYTYEVNLPMLADTQQASNCDKTLKITRNDIDFNRGSFRVKGDVIEVLPTYSKTIGVRIELFDDEIERIREFDIVTGEVLHEYKVISIFPATQFVTNKDKIEEGIHRIEKELEERIAYFKKNDNILEAERIKQRTNYDLEMLREIGSCPGVENYSRHLSLRAAGETPSTLMDFFGDDYLLIVDESHVSLPQVRGMHKGDFSRKTTLVDYGFRLPSAIDNRPLNFKEFKGKTSQIVYLSATPGDYEFEQTDYVVEQIIRPTGLLDPLIEIRPKKGQIDDIVEEILKRIEKNVLNFFK